MQFSQKLKILMEQFNITAYKLAKSINVHQTTIKNWLDGKYPSAGHLAKLANYFGTTVDRLLSDDLYNTEFDTKLSDSSIKSNIKIESPHNGLSEDEQFILKMYRLLSKEGKEKSKDYNKYLILNEKTKDGTPKYTFTGKIARGDGTLKEDIITIGEANDLLEKVHKFNVAGKIDL